MARFDAVTADGHYVAVAADTICRGTHPRFDLFLHHRSDQHVLFVARDCEVDAAALDDALARGRPVLYVNRDDVAAYRSYVVENLDLVLSNPLTPRDRKGEIVYQSAGHLMAELIADASCAATCQRAIDVARHIVTVVSAIDAVESILSMIQFDYTTHTHSVNVCVYGLAFARFVGLSDPCVLGLLSTGLLLHDVGKSRVDPVVLNRSGPLTADEFAHIKTHARHGESLLCERRDVPKEAIFIVGQHHERCDGKGYPQGLGGREIHEYARLSAVMDVFDALTTRRPYKEALSTFEALRLMREDVGHHDERMLRTLVRMLAGNARLRPPASARPGTTPTVRARQ